jgi:ankyrin repeat protein
MMLGATRGHTRVVSKLIEHGADIYRKNANGNTALMLAVVDGHMVTVKTLLDSGADTGLRNKKRERADHLADSNGHKDILALLRQQKGGFGWPFD